MLLCLIGAAKDHSPRGRGSRATVLGANAHAVIAGEEYMARKTSRERKLTRELHRRMSLFNERKAAARGTEIRTSTFFDGYPVRPRQGDKAILDTIGKKVPTISGMKCTGPYPVTVQEHIQGRRRWQED